MCECLDAHIIVRTAAATGGNEREEEEEEEDEEGGGQDAYIANKPVFSTFTHTQTHKHTETLPVPVCLCVSECLSRNPSSPPAWACCLPAKSVGQK